MQLFSALGKICLCWFLAFLNVKSQIIPTLNFCVNMFCKYQLSTYKQLLITFINQLWKLFETARKCFELLYFLILTQQDISY